MYKSTAITIVVGPNSSNRSSNSSSSISSNSSRSRSSNSNSSSSNNSGSTVVVLGIVDRSYLLVYKA